MEKTVYIIGGSGHALVVREIAVLNRMQVAGYFDPKQSGLLVDVNYLGEEDAKKIAACPPDAVFFPGVGDNQLRDKLVQFIRSQARKECILVHPGAVVSAHVTLGLSTLVGPRAVINPFSQIGEGVIVNSGAIIEHECIVGNFCHIAPGAAVLGNVQIGDFTFVGANAVIKQGVKIGSHAIIGAGSVVLETVPDNSTWVGNPAKRIR